MKPSAVFKLKAALFAGVLILSYNNCSGMGGPVAGLQSDLAGGQGPGDPNQPYVPSAEFKVVDDFTGVATLTGGQGNGTAVDSAGNIYSVGYPWLVRKWTKATGVNSNIDNFSLSSGRRTSVASAIAIDSAGNIFVAGWAADLAGKDHGILRMWSAATSQWKTVDDYTGTSTFPYAYNAVAIDKGGDVYLGGKFPIPLTTNSYRVNWATRKWTRATGTAATLPVSLLGEVKSVTVDKSGLVTFAGVEYLSGTQGSFMTAATYNPATGAWITEKHQPIATANAEASGVAADLDGNIYVVGKSSYNYADTWIVRKRDAVTGAWSTLDAFSDSVYNFNAAHAVTIDSAGNIYVAGKACLCTTPVPRLSVWMVRKYTSSTQSWSIVDIGGKAEQVGASHAVVDAAGNIAVIGMLDNRQLLRRFDQALGTWTTIDDYQNSTFMGEAPRAIHADIMGNLWAAGWSTNADRTARRIVRKRAVNTTDWIVVDEQQCANCHHEMAITSDAAGNVYLANSVMTSPVSGTYDNTWVVRKWTRSTNSWSNIEKTTRLAFPNSYRNLFLTAIGIDATGTILLSGYSMHNVDYTLRQLITMQWSPQSGWTGPFAYQQAALESATASAVVTDRSGGLYVVGTSEPASNIVNRQWTIRKFLGGVDMWQTSIDTSETNYKTTGSVNAGVADTQGNIYLAGGCASLNNQQLAWCVRKWNPATGVWTKLLADDRLVATQEAVAKSITIDAAGNLFVAGYAIDEIGIRRWMLKKFDGSTWTTIRNHTAGLDADAVGVTYDATTTAVFTLGLRTLGDGSHWTVDQY